MGLSLSLSSSDSLESGQWMKSETPLILCNVIKPYRVLVENQKEMHHCEDLDVGRRLTLNGP
jgi:hypothetical protein